jgi:DNA polymerase-3 subunit beta
VEFDEKNASFTMPSSGLSAAVEGNYPSYNSVIPQNNPNKLIIDRVKHLKHRPQGVSFLKSGK